MRCDRRERVWRRRGERHAAFGPKCQKQLTVACPSLLPWPKSNGAPMGRYRASDAAKYRRRLSRGSADPGQGGAPPGHYPPPHQWPRRCQECIQARGGHTHCWVTLWVALIKFTQVEISLWSELYVILNPVVSIGRHFVLSKSNNVHQSRFSTWNLPSLRFEVRLKCSIVVVLFKQYMCTNIFQMFKMSKKHSVKLTALHWLKQPEI